MVHVKQFFIMFLFRYLLYLGEPFESTSSENIVEKCLFWLYAKMKYHFWMIGNQTKPYLNVSCVFIIEFKNNNLVNILSAIMIQTRLELTACRIICIWTVIVWLITSIIISYKGTSWCRRDVNRQVGTYTDVGGKLLRSNSSNYR